jgi:hypothetical protein
MIAALILMGAPCRFHEKAISNLGVMHHFQCSQRIGMVRNLKEDQPKQRGVVPLKRFLCRGKVAIQITVDGTFNTSYFHGCVHEKRINTTPMQEVLDYIQENSALGPASLFFQLLLVYKDNREAIKHLTQKQVYYYWSKSFEGKFKRCEDEFESAKIRITEFRNVKLLFE